jgi:hypothetical protein
MSLQRRKEGERELKKKKKKKKKGMEGKVGKGKCRRGGGERESITMHICIE